MLNLITSWILYEKYVICPIVDCLLISNQFSLNSGNSLPLADAAIDKRTESSAQTKEVLAQTYILRITERNCIYLVSYLSQYDDIIKVNAETTNQFKNRLDKHCRPKMDKRDPKIIIKG